MMIHEFFSWKQKSEKTNKYRTVSKQGEYHQLKRVQLGKENKTAILKTIKERKKEN